MRYGENPHQSAASYKIPGNNEPNILIEPPIDQFYGWDFHKANELIDIGYDTAKGILNDNSELFI